MTTLDELTDRYRSAIQLEMRTAVGAASSELYAWMRFHLGWEDRAGATVQASPGKLMRPMAVLLATEAFGGDAGQALPAAAAVELVHNFSLLHDDVEDASEFRRGRENVWTFAGAPQAINTGDGMFVVSRLVEYRMLEAGMATERVLMVMRELDRACMRLVEGQYLDMSFETRRDVTLDDYLEMADGKTAAMFAAPFAMGSLIAGAPDPVVAAVREYGRQVGLAFQMVDDVLGIWGDSSVTGKPVGDDLHSRKMTYPIISALADESESGTSLREAYALPPSSSDAIESMSRWVAATGARERAEARAREHLRLAMESLDAAALGDAAHALFTEYAETAVGRVS